MGVHEDKLSVGYYKAALREITSSSRIPGILVWEDKQPSAYKGNNGVEINIYSCGQPADRPFLLLLTHPAQGLNLPPPLSPNPGSWILTKGDLWAKRCTSLSLNICKMEWGLNEIYIREAPRGRAVQGRSK